MSGRRYSPAEIDRVREQVRISEIVGQVVMWDKRKSNPRRGDYWGCCPFHGEKSPSFHVLDQRGIYHCFGCGVTGDVIKFVMEHHGKSFSEAMEILGGQSELVIDPAERARADADRRQRQEAAQRQQAADEGRVRETARDIWRASVPFVGTLAEAYLRGRGIDFPLERFTSIRFHGRLRYKDQATDKVLGHFPALVAGVQDPGGAFRAIWRIYLDELGNKNAAVPNPKLGLGNFTESGGAVRLGDPDGQANVCEGIETGFGILGILGPATASVQCALSTSGMVNWQAPAENSRALIWPDGDVDRIRRVKDRERKIESPGMAAAETLRERLAGEGFPASIQPTPKNGRDYLDVYNQMRKRLRGNG
jgi:hypothetical protein